MEYSELEHAGAEFSGQNISEAPENCLDVADSKPGGWKAFPYIIGSVLGLSLGASGWGSNLTVYLMTVFNLKSIYATQIASIVSGSSSLFPVAGAILADSFFGSFSVITTFSLISFTGMILITLTASINFLHPPPCLNTCDQPSPTQLAALYIGISLASLGSGGTGIIVATMGANQFENKDDQTIFFNWYFITSYACIAMSSTAIVYIQDKVSWGLGFGVCVAANATGFMVFVLGKRNYRNVMPKESPFVSIARVVVAAIRKRNVAGNNEDYFYGSNEMSSLDCGPTTNFSFLNSAALKPEGNSESDDPLIDQRSWKLCTVGEVEDLKTLIKLIPLWTSSILLSATIGVFISLTLLQALTMDKHFGPNFEVPAASFLIFNIISTCVSLSIIDRLVFPTWQKMTGHYPTPLQRIGVGHVINIFALVGSALVENRRLQVVKAFHIDQPGLTVPMSAFWLVINLIVIGIGEALHYPGQVAFYYQEFPAPLKNTATAMISLIVAIGFYSSAVVIGLVRRITAWLPDNINEGRVDNVYWIMAGIGLLNFGYYLTCAKFFRYKAADQKHGTAHCDSLK